MPWCLSEHIRLSIFKLRGGVMIFLLKCLDMARNVFLKNNYLLIMSDAANF